MKRYNKHQIFGFCDTYLSPWTPLNAATDWMLEKVPQLRNHKKELMKYINEWQEKEREEFERENCDDEF